MHAQVLDRLGTAICGGELPPGAVLNIDDLVDRYAVSRSVVREVLRVLASIGFVETRRRVGVMIRPIEEWNVFDPQVIRWRLASVGRITQLRSITELRAAVEPHAALLAAERVGHDEASDLVGLAAKMWAAGKAGDEERFLELDIEFHRRVLIASGNEMFVRLQSLVAEVLTGRHEHHLMPHHPHDQALHLHAEVAQAIQRRDGERARRAMVELMAQAFDEMRAIWEQAGDVAGA
ncbi:FadR/GntR family transcriptional regulator [Micromonospora okii]|uniref:FadR/GntR family transcriptional regulator n=1 Tax=Micromonospora okii TaxID=1182970 RepID=UPI001E37EBD8|nr:FCD domain-containing protein [Micromonospora okii]